MESYALMMAVVARTITPRLMMIVFIISVVIHHVIVLPTTLSRGIHVFRLSVCLCVVVIVRQVLSLGIHAAADGCTTWMSTECEYNNVSQFSQINRHSALSQIKGRFSLYSQWRNGIALANTKSRYGEFVYV